MIKANMQVAKMLVKTFQNTTILQSKMPPHKKELEEFAKCYGSALPLSAGCKVYFPNFPGPPTVSSLTMLKVQHSMLFENLRNKKLVDVMHCVQMEHLHPQLLALQCRLRSLQSPAEYCVLNRGDTSGGAHFDLQCSHYTHFTSPLRRYIDVVIQRQLHVALNRRANVYTAEEPRSVCESTQNMLTNAKEYEKGMKSLKLIKRLKLSQTEYDCVIYEIDIKQQKISLCFNDGEIRLGPKAREITSQQLHGNCLTGKSSPSDSRLFFKWKVKLCSIKGIPATFLDPTQVELEQKSDDQLILYIQEEDNCLRKKLLGIKLKSNVANVPIQTWEMLQKCTMEGQSSIKEHRVAIASILSPTEEKLIPIHDREQKSTLLVYTITKELKLFDVMKAQLCATKEQHGLTQEPAIQLLEVGPGLQICVHHNKYHEKCFVGKLTQNASKEKYYSLTEYVKCWEPLLLSESALTSVKDSEFLLIRDVEFKWPDFQLCTTSSGDTYYEIKNNSDSEISLKLPSQFVKSSFNFFKMSEGDLVCMRLSSSDGQTRYVFHMVITNVKVTEDTEPTADVYMKFDSNYISPEVHKLIFTGNVCYVFQLIHSSLPHRWVK